MLRSHEHYREFVCFTRLRTMLQIRVREASPGSIHRSHSTGVKSLRMIEASGGNLTANHRMLEPEGVRFFCGDGEVRLFGFVEGHFL